MGVLALDTQHQLLARVAVVGNPDLEAALLPGEQVGVLLKHLQRELAIQRNLEREVERVLLAGRGRGGRDRKQVDTAPGIVR